MTPKERLDILFATISIGSISAFNEAYNYIRNPNVKNDSGDTILTYSILTKRYPAMTSILSKGADPNMPNQLGYTPINIALELQDFKSLEILSENRADLKYIDGFGRNYLMHASRLGNLAAVALLIEKGIDINAMDNEGATALTIAYKYQQNIVATYLLKHGAKNSITKEYNPSEQSLIKELEDSWK
jgi:ankyrin repeat protein